MVSIINNDIQTVDNASTPLSLNEDVIHEAHPTVTSSTQNLLPNKIHNELDEDILWKSWWCTAEAIALDYLNTKLSITERDHHIDE